MTRKKSILKGGIAKGTFHMTSNGMVEILEIIDPWNVRVQFLEYPCEVIIESGQLRRGEVKNPMRPTVKSVGFMGVGPYQPRGKGDVTKSYSAWSNMLGRVYEPADEELARQYAGTSVHPNWHNYQNFALWYHNQIDRFGSVDFTWELDKDFLVPCNRIYGPETCCLIPKAINVLLTDNAKGRGDLPLGVTRHGNGYRPRVGKKSLGTYKTIAEAQQIYWRNKFQSMQSVTIKYWQYLPEPLAFRLLTFGWKEAREYYGDDAIIWEGR